jgi:hypothetical protein
MQASGKLHASAWRKSKLDMTLGVWMQLLPLPGTTVIVQPAVSHITGPCDTKHFLQLLCAYLLVNNTLLKKKGKC